MSSKPFVDENGTALSPNDFSTWSDHYQSYTFSINDTVSKGGDDIKIETRTHGIKYGFKTIVTSSNPSNEAHIVRDEEGVLIEEYDGLLRETNGQLNVTLLHQNIIDNINDGLPIDTPRV